MCNYTVWKCARSLGLEVSERMYKLNMCVKLDSESPVTSLQLDFGILLCSQCIIPHGLHRCTLKSVCISYLGLFS